MKLTISVEDVKGNDHTFALGDPISVSRQIKRNKHSQAFSLPEFQTKTVEIEDVFIGDVTRGGSCNVDVLSFTPHNLTHLETSSHILNQNKSKSTVKDIPQSHFHGLLFLADISDKLSSNDRLISKELIQEALNTIDLPINAFSIKTRSSSLPEQYDFSNKEFVALSEEVSKLIHDYRNGSIKNLILDLPSADPENDEGKLLAHRAFFGISKKGFESNDQENRVICELAYFKNLVQQYYYFIITPARIESNAMISDILFFPIIEE